MVINKFILDDLRSNSIHEMLDKCCTHFENELISKEKFFEESQFTSKEISFHLDLIKYAHADALKEIIEKHGAQYGGLKNLFNEYQRRRDNFKQKVENCFLDFTNN